MNKRLIAKTTKKLITKKTGRAKIAITPAKIKAGQRTAAKATEYLYALTIHIIDGPMSEEYQGQEISRTIQIKGSQTLEALHYAIFEAFERWENHMYEFNLGKGPHDRSKIYAMRPMWEGFEEEEKPAGYTTTTTLDALGLKAGRAFGYAFDFGDDWQHQINVDKIEAAPSRGKYPKITKRVGDCPPQYLEEDDGEFDDDED